MNDVLELDKVETEQISVCIIDDDPSVAKATSRLISSAGWKKVESFTDPIEFLRHAETCQPKIVILDIFMPGMNGLEVQKRLRTISPDSRVIVLTSADDPKVRQEAIQGGAAAFFTKPVDDEEFLAEIKSVSSRN